MVSEPSGVADEVGRIRANRFAVKHVEPAQPFDKLTADQQYAVRELKVTSTPTFFLNGVRLQGSMPFEELEERIKPLLRK